MPSQSEPVVHRRVPNTLPTPSSLTKPILSDLLALYDPILAYIASTKRKSSKKPANDLQQVDELRYKTIPRKIHERKSTADEKQTDQSRHGWLDKAEVEDLVAWKLSRGTFRPTLPALIRSNDAAVVTDTTTKAFALYATSRDDPFPALKSLAALRGVGPATASLLLAAAFPDDVPFFADEILLWLRRSDGEEGWEKPKLKYDWKEYREVWDGVGSVRGRFGEEEVSAEDVERAGWVVEMLRDEGVEAVFRGREKEVGEAGAGNRGGNEKKGDGDGGAAKEETGMEVGPQTEEVSKDIDRMSEEAAGVPKPASGKRKVEAKATAEQKPKKVKTGSGKADVALRRSGRTAK